MKLFTRQISRQTTQATHNTLLPESASHLGLDTRNITEPIVNIKQIQRHFELYNHLQTLEHISTHPINRLRIAHLCLDELLYPNEQTSKFNMSPVKGGLLRGLSAGFGNGDDDDDHDDDNDNNKFNG